MTILKGPSIFTVGSDLWITPDPDHSAWTQKLDWYLNGLISRAEHHRPTQVSPTLVDIMKKEELEIPKTPEVKSCLLISSALYLPNEETVVLEYAGSISQWTKRASEIWTELGKPTLRIFLPKGTTSTDFLKHWTEPKNGLTFVEALS